MNKKMVCLELMIMSTFPLIAQVSENVSVEHSFFWWLGTALLCISIIATISLVIYCSFFEDELILIGIILLCTLPFEINGLVSLFLWWNYWYTFAFVLVGILLIVIIACSLTPLILFDEHNAVAFTSILSLALTIGGCVLIKSKLHDIWWLWKYLLVGAIGIAVSWILAGIVILIKKSIAHIVEIRPEKLAEKERKREEKRKNKKLEKDRNNILAEQKEAEQQREEENRQLQLEKLIKKVEDAVLLFQSSVDRKESVNLQLLKMIEDALSEMQSCKNRLEKHDIEELKRNKIYCNDAFEIAKKLEGFTQSANVRMDEILKMFDDVAK